jgi:hypothetical protein
MATTTTERKCVCGCLEKWHNTPFARDKKRAMACQSPDCPCRKFEPAGGDA